MPYEAWQAWRMHGQMRVDTVQACAVRRWDDARRISRCHHHRCEVCVARSFSPRFCAHGVGVAECCTEYRMYQ